MAVNKPYGDNARKGAVRERSQVLNPKTNLYVKRNANTIYGCKNYWWKVQRS